MGFTQSDYRVGHLFADHGCESEVLATLGHVTRVTLDPEPNPFVDETIQMDLMEETPDLELDLALLHPKCTDVSTMTSISGDPEEHENQVGRAREIAEEVAEDYIIENRPRGDLRDPTVLNGRMFGLPADYRRAFETTFPVRPPTENNQKLPNVSPFFYPDRSAEWWAAVKGYRGDYPKQHLAKNALPSVYVQRLLWAWLEARNDRDGQTPRTSDDLPDPEMAQSQAKLTEVPE